MCDTPIARITSCVSSLRIYIIKIKIHSSCEIEDFVETHLCKLCVIYIYHIDICDDVWVKDPRYFRSYTSENSVPSIVHTSQVDMEVHRFFLLIPLLKSFRRRLLKFRMLVTAQAATRMCNHIILGSGQKSSQEMEKICTIYWVLRALKVW